MKHVKSLAKSTKKSNYIVYTYVVTDELGNKESIDSLQQFKDGDRVETWYDATYNKPKMRLYERVRK